MPRRVRDFVLAALGAAFILGAIALVDRRVPGEVAGIARQVSTGGWHARGSFVDNVLVQVAKSPMTDDIFLLAMVGAGVVLVILMVRT
jgi:hypothetical protein